MLQDLISLLYSETIIKFKEGCVHTYTHFPLLRPWQILQINTQRAKYQNKDKTKTCVLLPLERQSDTM